MASVVLPIPPELGINEIVIACWPEPRWGSKRGSWPYRSSSDNIEHFVEIALCRRPVGRSAADEPFIFARRDLTANQYKEKLALC